MCTLHTDPCSLFYYTFFLLLIKKTLPKEAIQKYRKLPAILGVVLGTEIITPRRTSRIAGKILYFCKATGVCMYVCTVHIL